MIKGHMTIELGDGKTGEVVERHEDDNLVTNGIKHYFKNMGFMNPTPIYNTTGQLIANNPQNLAIPLFGGLLLFDTAQTENAEHIFVSGGTKMTQVWDFTTSQANGTIACACLVPRNYGAYGEGNGTSRVIKTNPAGMTDYAFYQYPGYPLTKQLLSRPDQFFGAGYEAYPIYINTDDNYAILLGYKAGGNSPQQFKTVKVAFPWSKIDIRDGMNNGGRVIGEVQDVTIPSQINASRAWVNRPYSFIGRDRSGAFYLAINSVGYASYNFNATYPTHIVKFVVGANDAVTCEYVMALSPSLIGQTTGDYFYITPHHLEIVGDNLFLATGTVSNTLDRTKWYKINLNTRVAETVEDLTASNFTGFAPPWLNIAVHDSDSIYILNASPNMAKVDLVAKTVVSLNAFEGSMPNIGYYGLIDDRCALYVSINDSPNNPVAGQIYRYLHFLSTINNLESPVVKTPDKTMKVTYVLRFDAE